MMHPSYTRAERIAILKELNWSSISIVRRRYGIHSNEIKRWQKRLSIEQLSDMPTSAPSAPSVSAHPTSPTVDQVPLAIGEIRIESDRGLRMWIEPNADLVALDIILRTILNSKN